MSLPRLQDTSSLRRNGILLCQEWTATGAGPHLQLMSATRLSARCADLLTLIHRTLNCVRCSISVRVFRRLCPDELCSASSKQEACYLLGDLLALIKKLGSLGTGTIRTDSYQEGAFPHSAYHLL